MASAPAPAVNSKRVTIAFKDLAAFPADNARQVMSEIDTLAASIKSQGLLEPITARAIDGKPGKYAVKWGFRRHAALKELGYEGEIDILVTEESEAECRIKNIVENEQREPLLPWELAEACVYLREKHNFTGNVIGARIGKSKAHINNLMRVVDNLHKHIYDGGFKTGQIPLSLLFKWSGMEEKEQWAAYQKYINATNEEEGGGEGNGEGGGGTGSEEPEVKRLSVKKSLAFLEALSKDQTKSPDWRKGARAATKYLLGMTRDAEGRPKSPITVKDGEEDN